MKISLFKKYFYYYKFLKRNHYLPSLSNPKTFNEKLNYRKFFSKNSLFSLCADKIAVKKYVADKIGEKYIIKTLYQTKHIDSEQIKKQLDLHNSFVLKANHNSGHIYFIDKKTSKEDINKACNALNRELTRDFGKRKNENWYSSIKPEILLEENIKKNPQQALVDYKFHIFKQNSSEVKVVLCVIFDRGNNSHCSYFDEELNWIPFSQGYPCIITQLTPPKNYTKMLDLAKQLAEPFNYVRVDFYNQEGEIKFGEFTFADGSGFERFSSYEYDLWLGNLWQSDLCN